MGFSGTNRTVLSLEMSFSIAQGIDDQRSNSSTQGPSLHEHHGYLQSPPAFTMMTVQIMNLSTCKQDEPSFVTKIAHNHEENIVKYLKFLLEILETVLNISNI